VNGYTALVIIAALFVGDSIIANLCNTYRRTRQ
jgi:hypothetical protein